MNTTMKGNMTTEKAKATTEATMRGFQLGTATRVLGKRPTITVKARFYSLKRGMAYPLAVAAKEWACSMDTLREHAKDADCFRYVETKKEEFSPCIMHPDTAKLYPVK